MKSVESIYDWCAESNTLVLYRMFELKKTLVLF